MYLSKQTPISCSNWVWDQYKYLRLFQGIVGVRLLDIWPYYTGKVTTLAINLETIVADSMKVQHCIRITDGHQKASKAGNQCRQRNRSHRGVIGHQIVAIRSPLLPFSPLIRFFISSPLQKCHSTIITFVRHCSNMANFFTEESRWCPDNSIN